MEKYLIKKSANANTTTQPQGAITSNNSSGSSNASRPAAKHNSAVPELVDLNKLPRDPAKRKRMADYHPNQRDEIRRKYLIWGPNQPRKLEFPYREIGKKKKKRRFNPDWYDDYAYWLEYSEKEHKAYCLCCYLFRDNIKDSHHGHDAFVVEGFNCWNKTERFVTHVGDRNSFHNRALKDCEDLLKQDQSIPAAWNRQSQTEKNEHLIRLNAAIDVCRYLLHQGQPFRGHDESKDSENKGNYLELMDYTIKQNDVVAKAFKNAPNNNQMLSPKIQRDITECFAKEVLGHVMKEIGNGVFSLLVDECRDVSDKEQMAVVLRYLDKCGLVQEKFVGVVHVEETTASYLKSCIDLLFSQLGLNLEQVRGQGYDGASNMSGEFNGLQAKIMNENKSAYYVHCFAHKLNLVVVAIAKKIFEVGDFFDMVSVLLNVVGASCKRKDQLREHHQEEVRKAIGCGEIATGTGLNQELSLQRPDVESTKRELEKLRTNEGWDSLMKKVCCFCEKHDIPVLDMEDAYVNPKKPRQKTGISNEHYYRVDCFFAVLDLLGEEFNDIFNEVNSELLLCMPALSPSDLFCHFDKEKLLKLAKFYPDDFNHKDMVTLEHELGLYIDNILHDTRFSSLDRISDLAKLMVDTRKNLSYPLVYRLLKLALTLSVATATVERCFSAMKIVKNALRNKIGDDYLSHSLICFVEKELLDTITNEVIVDRFYKMKDRRGRNE
uniref:TTF-type domain-containing protein n=1 Tax=Triticum urartu TaxID=4572 RepID=A0A8R7THM1_TRIUA